MVYGPEEPTTILAAAAASAGAPVVVVNGAVSTLPGFDFPSTIASIVFTPSTTTHPTPSPSITSHSAPTQPSVITATVIVATTIIPTSTHRSGLTSGQKAAIAVPILLVALGLFLVGFFLFLWRRRPQRANKEIETHPQPKLEETTVLEDVPKKQ